MSAPTTPEDVAAATRMLLVDLAGRFMTSPELAEQEAQLGVPRSGLYFRGRSAVLGDPPASVVAAAFGIFPTRLVEIMLERTPVPAATAVGALAATCWQWGRNHLAGAPSPHRAAALLYRVVDDADLSGLPLVAGWRSAPRPGPGDDLADLAHALNLARELRGGLHFCALRAVGLTAHQAVAVHPEEGRRRLLRLGWRATDADALLASVADRPDLLDRWHHAESLTTAAFAATLAVLTPDELAELRTLLAGVPDAPPAG
ncbi:MAG TPA: hypothetical protein VGD67_17440 [Pseudonocardiaceae bacterium]